MPANLENSAVATGLANISFHSNRKERQCLRSKYFVQSTTQLHSSHMLAKWCSKFSKPGFNSTWSVNFQMFKLDFKKAEESETRLPTSTGSSKKQESSRKNIYFSFIRYAKAFDFVGYNKLENSERDGNTRSPYLPPEKSVCKSRSNS